MTQTFLTTLTNFFVIAALLFGSLYAQADNKQPFPFEQDKVEKKLEKLFEKQIRQQPYSFATIKVTDCITRQQTKSIEVRMDKGFADFYFDGKIAKSVYQTFKKALYKPFRHFSLRITTMGIDVYDLTDNPLQMMPSGKDKWGNIDYQGAPWVSNISSPVVPTLGLTNRHLSLWASHGRFYDNKKDTWRWQRPKLFGTTEDLFTPTIVNTYLIPMLENAGATVFTPRERDTQPHELIIDNDAPQTGATYIEVGGRKKWKTAPEKGFAYHSSPYDNGDNPFEAGTVRMAPATKKTKNYNLISYQPQFPEEGEYAVYASYLTLPNSVDDAHYTIWHQGVKTELRVNQRMGGSTWVYLGTFRFDKGSNQFNRVVVTNQSSRKGVVTTDAIRFGGGMGNIRRGGETSGMPRCLEGARYYAQWAGMSPNIYNGRKGTDDYADDINTRSLMSNWIGGGSCYMPGIKGMKVPLELSLAIHSDAGFDQEDGVLTGSLGICTTNFNDGLLQAGISRQASNRLAQSLVDNLDKDLSKRYGHWVSRGVWDRNYSETRLPAVPSAILETMSHQNFSDMRLGQDPEFRFHMARSIYKSLLRYVGSQHGKATVISPLTPSHFHISQIGDGVVELGWEAVEDETEPSAHPNGYIVYMSEGTAGFDNGTYVHSTNRYRIQLEPGVLYSFKVAAVNRGGCSFPTSALCARWSPQATKTVMIVDACQRLASPAIRCNKAEQGFDFDLDPGIDRGKAYRWAGKQICFNRARMGKEGEGGLGWSDDSLTGLLIAGDKGDRVISHAQAIAAAGNYNILSCDGQSLQSGDVTLDRCDIMDVATALQRNDGYSRRSEKAIPAYLQLHIRNFTQKGGALLLSGAYIGTDMISVSETAFMRDLLKCNFTGSYRESNDTLSGMGTHIRFYHALNDRHYAATSTDMLQPIAPAFATMVYANGQGAAIAYSGSYKAVTIGFPLECIQEQKQMNLIMRGLLTFLSTNK